MEIKEKAIGGAKWISFSTITCMLINVIQLSIVARFLSMEDIGLFAIISIILGVATLFSDIGISKGVVHFKNLNSTQLNTLYWLNIFCAFIVWGLIILMSPLLDAFYQNAELSKFLWLVSFNILIVAFGQQFRYLLQRELAFKTLAIIELISRIMAFVLTLILIVVLELGLMALIIGLIGHIIIQTVFYVFYGLKYHTPNLRVFDFKSCEPVIQFGLYEMGRQILIFFSSNLDKLIIGKFFGLDILGAYELAKKLVIRPLQIINPIFNRISFPVFSALQSDHHKLNHWYIEKVRLISFLVFPIYFGLFLMSEEVIFLLYGAGWDLATQIFEIIWVLGLFLAIANPLGSYLLGLGKSKIGFYANLYGIVVHVIALGLGSMFFSFLPMLSFYIAVVIILMLPIGFWIRYYLTRMGLGEQIRALLPNLILSFIMFLLLWLIKTYVLGDISMFVLFTVLILSGGLIYTGLSRILNKKPLLFILKNLKV